MFVIIKNILLAVFLGAALSLCEKNDCIVSDYADSTSELVYKCREGCTGSVPNCLPVCDNGCPSNSRCESPNICVCDTGYVINETNPDMIPSLKSCRPSCETQCPTHSHCFSYNTCECDEGYVADQVNPDVIPSLQSCKPHCDVDCPENSHCSTPNSCVCDKGYKPNTNNENDVPSLESCKKQEEMDSFVLRVVVYSLLICSFIFITLGGIAILIIWMRRSNTELAPPTYNDSIHGWKN